MKPFSNFSFVSSNVLTDKRVSNLNQNNLTRSVVRNNEAVRNGVLFDRSAEHPVNVQPFGRVEIK